MKLLDNIKARVGKQVIDGRIKNIKRDASFLNLGDAGSIGIIYDATDSGSFGIIKDFAKQLSERNIKLNVLGYVDTKELAEEFLYRKGFDFFCRKHLNWYFKPVSPLAEKFINEQFDILFDLSLDKTYPVQFITALSPARFKAGRYSPEDTYLDLMIDISGDKQGKHESLKPEFLRSGAGRNDKEVQLIYLIEQLIHYLSIIKNN